MCKSSGNRPVYQRILNLILLCSYLLISSGSHGQLLCYEGFDNPQKLTSLGNGTFSIGNGWAAPWVVQNNSSTAYQISDSRSLTYPDITYIQGINTVLRTDASGSYCKGGEQYQTAGRSLNMDINTGSPFLNYIDYSAFNPNDPQYIPGKTTIDIGKPGTTMWLSVLLRKDDANVEPVFVTLHTKSIYPNVPDYQFDVPVSIGYFGAESDIEGDSFWGLKIGNTPAYSTGHPVNIGETALLVLKITWGQRSPVGVPTFTQFMLIANPTLGSPTPSSSDMGVATLYNGIFSFRHLAYYGGNTAGQSSMDEIRLGGSYSDIAPYRDNSNGLQILSKSSLLAFDNFTYPLGNINGKGKNGNGWSSNWGTQNDGTGYALTQTTSFTAQKLNITKEYLTGGGNYFTTGRSFAIGGVNDLNPYVAQGNIGKPSKTVWLSFLLRKENDNAEDVKIVLHKSNINWNIEHPVISVGYFNDAYTGGKKNWELKIGNDIVPGSQVPFHAGRDYFFVLKITFGIGDEGNISLYHDPVPGSNESDLVAVCSIDTRQSLAFKNIAFYGGSSAGQGSLDEIRLGKDFNAVAPGFGISKLKYNGLLAYEGFGLGYGTLDGVGSKIGWLAPWVQVSNTGGSTNAFRFDYKKPLNFNGISAYYGLVMSSNYITTPANVCAMARSFELGNLTNFGNYIKDHSIGTPGKKLWISFLVRNDPANTIGELSVMMVKDLTNANIAAPEIAVGFLGNVQNKIAIKINSATYYNNTVVPPGLTARVILEITFGDAGQNGQISMDVYVPGSGDEVYPGRDVLIQPVSGDISFRHLVLRGSMKGSLDEIRFADNYWSVLPKND